MGFFENWRFAGFMTRPGDLYAAGAENYPRDVIRYVDGYRVLLDEAECRELRRLVTQRDTPGAVQLTRAEHAHIADLSQRIEKDYQRQIAQFKAREQELFRRQLTEEENARVNAAVAAFGRWLAGLILGVVGRAVAGPTLLYTIYRAGNWVFAENMPYQGPASPGDFLDGEYHPRRGGMETPEGIREVRRIREEIRLRGDNEMLATYPDMGYEPDAGFPEEQRDYVERQSALLQMVGAGQVPAFPANESAEMLQDWYRLSVRRPSQSAIDAAAFFGYWAFSVDNRGRVSGDLVLPGLPAVQMVGVGERPALSLVQQVQIQSALARFIFLGGAQVLVPFQKRFGCDVQKINKTQFQCTLDGVRIMYFGTSSQAKGFAKKINSALKYAVRRAAGIEGTDFGNAVNQFVADGANPANNFDPIIVIAS